MDFLIEFWGFLKERKKWWLLPIFTVLFVLMLLIILGSINAGAAPFIYTLF